MMETIADETRNRTRTNKTATAAAATTREEETILSGNTKDKEEPQSTQIHVPFIQMEITLEDDAFKMQTIQTVPTQMARGMMTMEETVLPETPATLEAMTALEIAIITSMTMN